MNYLSRLLIASAVILLPWGPSATAVAAEPTAAQASPPATGDSEKLRHLLANLPGNGHRKHESYGDVVLRHIDTLKLNDEQVGRIERIHRENQARIEEIAKTLRETRHAAYQHFLNPASDEAAVRKAAKEHTAAFEELVETALKSRAAINAVLTPDQANQLKSLKLESKPSHDQESTYP